MITSRVRSALLGSAVGVGLIAASTTANALEYNFGGVQVFLDTTVSAGVSMRVAERNMQHVSAGNGGPVNTAAVIVNPAGPNGAVATALHGATANQNLATGDTTSYAGSINADDSRLNFDRGDLTSGTVKMTNDIQANWENYKFFARVSSFYDAVLGSGSSYERSGIRKEAYPDAVRDIDLLDFYVSGDFNVGELPLNVRIGKQVVNWGEATFFLNGISSWSPFDVNAFRRPGAEVREGLLPVWGAYASLGLPYDLSLEAFYQFDFEPLQLDRPGTPFASSDVARVGSAAGGNVDGATWVTGGRSGGAFLNRNCSEPSALTAAYDAAYTANGLSQFSCAAATNPFLNYLTDLPAGQQEALRLSLNGGTADIRRLEDDEADDQGQYGVALRWYAEDLNSTEFGFYFMNYHSRLPIVGERFFNNNSAANSVVRTYVATGNDSSATTRGSLNAGCAGAGTAGLAALLGGGAAGLAKLTFLNGQTASDTYGLVAAAEAVVGDGATSAAALALNGAIGGGFAVAQGSLLELMITNCALSAAQTSAALIQVDGTELLVNGTAPGGLEAIGLFLEYPEDIKLLGMSFNTTVGDWGVQGEVSFRHDQPFQADTDQITLAALGASCILDNILGVDTMTTTVDALQTYGEGQTCGSVASGSVQTYSGVIRDEVMTFDIGTTATYTNSNALVGALGADIGILLTELAGIYVPDVPDEGDFSVRQWGNVCSSGTDLPLGGFVALSNRTDCRPDKFSYGYVLVGILQYNNAFGTPITLSPRLSWSHNVKGNSPAPMSNFREGNKSLSLALDGSYQNTWRGGISYTNNMANEKFSRDGDKDFVAINLSYSF
ncbi:MAG: DUF1302 domain-containing protein [Rhodobiaceae bacterium]|nr:DUF1302 domain-containing protein [Rhodobiaceae bacterium]